MDLPPSVALALLVALLVGLALGWLLGRAGAARSTAALRTALHYEREQAAAVRTLSGEAGDALASRAEAELGRAVEPLRERLGDLQRHLAALERQRAEAWSGLREQVEQTRSVTEQLRGQTGALAGALRAGDVRGRWGEVQLRRVVELAGMVEHCDFDDQPVLRAADGGVQRPDLVVRLAGGRALAVDAKVPLSAYLEAQSCDAPQAAERLRAHAARLRAHVDELASRGYWAALDESPELVVLFVPSDAVLDAALRADPALLEHAFARGVVPATPSTLVALLRTAALGWRQEALAEGAQEVSRLGSELVDRLGTLGGHVDKVGRSLAAAVDSYNRAVGSLETRVLVSARRFRDLGVGDATLPTPEPLTVVPRPLTAPELLEDVG